MSIHSRRQRAIFIWGILALILLAACSPTGSQTSESAELPFHGVVLPTHVPPTAGPSPTALPTDTPTPTDTPLPSDTPTPSHTPTPTDTPLPTDTLTPTPTITPSALSEDVIVELSWATTSNIDLGVEEPTGALIASIQPSSPSGGTFSADANAVCSVATTEPSEQVIWPAGTAPAGHYVAFARYQAACGNSGPVDVTLRIYLGDEVLLEETASLQLGQEFRLGFDFDLVTVAAVAAESTGGGTVAPPIAYGDTVTGEISDDQPAWQYTFEGTEGDVITIDLRQQSGNLDTYLILQDSEGNQLIANDDGENVAVSTDSRIENYTLPATDTYTIVATRFQGEVGSSSGEFALTLERLLGAGETTSGGFLAYGASARGMITDEQFAAEYTFLGNANDVVTITMQRRSGNLDAYLLLMNGRGEILALNDDALDSEAPTDARINRFLLPATGTYTIVATRSGQERGVTSGVFALTLELVGSGPEEASDENRVLRYGESITGIITDENFEVRYTFVGEQGDTVTISLIRQSGDLDAYLELLDASGNLIASNDDAPDMPVDTDSRITNFRLPVFGPYTIVATRFQGVAGNSTGEFELSLDRAVPDESRPPAAEGGMIGYDQQVTGTITNEHYEFEYVFFGTAGDVITIDLRRQNENEDLDTLLLLLDADGNQLAINDDIRTPDGSALTDSRIANLRLPQTGQYTIVATRFQGENGSSSGAFVLSLTLVSIGSTDSLPES